MATPSAVFTIARVAAMLGEDEDWLSDVALEMDPEAGRVTIYGLNDEGTTGSIPASQKPKTSGGFDDAIARLLGRPSPPAKRPGAEDRITHSY